MITGPWRMGILPAKATAPAGVISYSPADQWPESASVVRLGRMMILVPELKLKEKV